MIYEEFSSKPVFDHQTHQAEAAGPVVLVTFAAQK
jgi:hypothetical protein